jgi:hypothetical protein
MSMSKQLQSGRDAFNAGYKDSINNRPAVSPGDFYYMMGYDEGYPKRHVTTYIITARGPVKERCSLERAAFLLAHNRHVPGARR